MNLSFELSMPGSPSWNGKWSGEGKIYAVIKKFPTIKAREKAVKIIAESPYYYRWTDGWCACIRVREVDSNQVRQIRKASRGFCGYEWMIDTIISHGKPLADHELREVAV